MFKSQKDIVYSLVVWGTMIFVFVVIIFNFSLTITGVFTGILGSVTIYLLIWIWFGTNYRIEKEYILIKNGPFKEKIAIQDITSVSKTKSILATPSLAMNRLLIRYGRYGEIMLSPKNKNEFINLLLIKNPKIEKDGKIFKN